MRLHVLYIALTAAITGTSAYAQTAAPETWQAIAPGWDSIRVQGTRYVTPSDTGLRFQRHREATLQQPRKALGVNPEKARSTSGIVITFQTDSPAVRARFQVLTANYMGSAFGVYENGQLIEEFKFNPKQKELELEWSARQPGPSRFEIALPSFANVVFRGLDIEAGSAMAPPAERPRTVYVAMGDSISHGVGQEGATHKTWPFILSRKLDAELFNLAVGGGKVSVPIGEMLEDWDRIDVITILIGYNDLHFDRKSPEAYRAKYQALLDAIREHHPDTRIYCITPLYTRKPESEKTGHHIQQFRDALAELIKTRQASDRHLYLVAGDSVSSEKNLRTDRPEDPVHLSVEGAGMLADQLYSVIQQGENRP